ncbi:MULTISPECIES: ferredoxin [Nocardiopsis]|jgi:ferredoxin|uniref:ferredoxin n=1 Tax=Nocardiopsis TaxID=2013 RepID=UPI00034D7801|nr:MULTISPECIES: ferredoxin [Nocardiopsis]MEC3892042.1 ferredoxin [Nocardiopsis sp. LDBS1602]
MKVHVDMALCASHGRCVFAAPDVFSFDDDEELTYEPSPGADRRAEVEQAVLSCPVRAITLDGDHG